MEKPEDKSPKGTASGDPPSEAPARNRDAELATLTDKWKRALAEAENARKRADAGRREGREHGIALAVDALAPAFDAINMAIEAARHGPDADSPQTATHLDGLDAVKAAFETGLKALGVRTIEPKDTPFDPQLHEAMQIHETETSAPGQVIVLHRPGFALAQRLIRPAHVTVSAAPSTSKEN